MEDVRRRLVERGFEETLDGPKRSHTPTPGILHGRGEAQVIAMWLSAPTKGFGKWTLRLLARKVIELKVVESISHETIRRTLQKTT